MLKRVGCVATWVTWVRGLRESVCAWVNILRGLRGTKFLVSVNFFYVG